ncbi:hypothetical protein GPALN_015568, partial [Globodera pallida]
DMFMQLQKEDEEKATEKAKPIQNQQTMKQFVSGGVKRPFSASSCSVLSDEQMFSDEENEVQSTSTAWTSFVKMIVRDAAEVMAISDGLKKLSKIEELENILERVKKFIRKLRKSQIQREEFQQIQKNLELPANVLIKDMEAIK